MNNILLSSLYLYNISNEIYGVLCCICVILVIFGIFLMSKVKLAVIGNRLSALSMLCGIILTLLYKNILNTYVLYIAITIGLIIGLYLSIKVKMIQMPQMVALLNGFGGLASGIMAGFALMGVGAKVNAFALTTSALGIAIGMITFSGSLIAALKLHKVLSQKPVVLNKHQLISNILISLIIILIIISGLLKVIDLLNVRVIIMITLMLISLGFGIIFSIRVGGADMPITISLLNSLSGVAGAIAGMAVGDILLVSVGGIVGASGLLLTQIMCKSMNRSLKDILLGKTSSSKTNIEIDEKKEIVEKEEKKIIEDPIQIIKNAKSVIIVPGYGMAIAQAQHLVKELADLLVANGAEIKYAVHPVAGRMPGHMNVLLCEADVDYEDLYEMDNINPEFKDTDVTIVVGANDVLNPAARTKEDTPIYGMPVLNVDECKHVYIFNYDTKPGYAGVDNPLYKRINGVYLYLGNASDTLKNFIDKIK